MAWEPHSEAASRAAMVACAILALTLATATMPASSAASESSTEHELPVRIGSVEDVAQLEPADPRVAELQARAPAASDGLYEGHLSEHGWPVHLVVADEWSLGLVSTPGGPAWVELADDGLVPLEQEMLAEASLGPIDRELHAPEDVPQPPKAETASPKDGTLQIALEGDFEYYGRMIDAWDEYQLAIIHLVEAVFLHTTGVGFEVVDQRIQTTNDQPVTGNKICEGVEDDVLDQFRIYREDEAPTVDSVREVAHLFTAKSFPNTNTIGCAYISEIDTRYAYGVSKIHGPVMVDDAIQDAMLVAHEIGHNFDGWHYRALPKPGGSADLGSCGSWTTIMYPCIDGAKIPTFSTAPGPDGGPLDALDVVEDGGNQPHMEDYGTSRT